MAGRLGDTPDHGDGDPVPHPGPGSATQMWQWPHQFSWDMLHKDIHPSWQSVAMSVPAPPLPPPSCGDRRVSPQCHWRSVLHWLGYGAYSLHEDMAKFRRSKGESPKELRPCCVAWLQHLQEQMLAARCSLGEDSCTGDAEQGSDAAGRFRCLWAVSQPCSPVGAPGPKRVETRGSEQKEHRGQGAGNALHRSSISVRSKWLGVAVTRPISPSC